MGAGDGDGGGPGPHPKDKHPQDPCDDSPHRPPGNTTGLPRPLPATPQVDHSETYAVAGKILLAAAGAFAGVLLALVALHLYHASRRRRRSSTTGGGRRLVRSLAIAGGDDDDRDGAAAPSPRGLDPAVLRLLPVVVVAPGAAAAAGDCAVCLAELEPGDRARELPRCGHRFHAECIDAWFRGNATCPLCRADVAPQGAAAAAAPSAPPEPVGAALPEVRIDVAGDAAADASSARRTAMGRLPSGTDLDKPRRVLLPTASLPSDRRDRLV